MRGIVLVMASAWTLAAYPAVPNGKSEGAR